MDIDYPAPSPLSPASWPDETWFHFVRFLEPQDLLTLRLVNHSFNQHAINRATWSTVAREIVKDRPLPINLPVSLYSLVTGNDSVIEDENATLYALIQACTTAARAQKNWEELPQPRLRKMVVFNPGAAKRDVDIATLLTPGSRYLICTDYYPDEKQNRLTISDIHLQVMLGNWAFPMQSYVLTYRPVENGAAIMFVIQPGIVRADGLVEYELVRFEFSTDPNQLEGRFMSHSIFRQPRQLNDLSLSEDFILITDLDDDSRNTVVFELFNWRTGATGRIRTSILSPPETYNLNITGETLTLWVHSKTAPRVYQFPMELLNYSLRDDVDEVQAPDIPPIHLQFEETVKGYEQLELLQTWRARRWQTTKNDRVNDRPWIVSQYCRAPDTGQEGDEDYDGTIRLTIRQYHLPLPFTGTPLLRTYLLDGIRVQLSTPPPDTQEPPFPFIEFNTKYGCWVEVMPHTQERVVNFLTFPAAHNMMDRSRDPDWWRRERVKQFPIPSTLDLRELRQLGLDEPSGILALTMTDGRLWLLYYDGYDDEQFNITEARLQEMFPDHTGVYSLGRLPA